MLPLLSGIVGYSHLNATTYSCQYIFANSRLAIPKTGLPLLFPLSRLTPAAPTADGLRIIDPVHFIETLERDYAS